MTLNRLDVVGIQNPGRWCLVGRKLPPGTVGLDPDAVQVDQLVETAGELTGPRSGTAARSHHSPWPDGEGRGGGLGLLERGPGWPPDEPSTGNRVPALRWV